MQKIAANRSKWGKRTKPMPATNVIHLPFRRVFSHNDIEQFSFDWVPEEMEDKWYGLYRDQTIHLYRSWTCFEIFQLSLQMNDNNQLHCIEGMINNDPEQHRLAAYPDGTDGIIPLLNHLLDAWISCDRFAT